MMSVTAYQALLPILRLVWPYTHKGCTERPNLQVTKMPQKRFLTFIPHLSCVLALCFKYCFFPIAPCVPYHIETFAECEVNLGAVSWAGSDGAEIYTAIAQGQDGHSHICITNRTFCIWEDLHCGEIYVVQVIANAQICSSNPSERTIINMGELLIKIKV